MAEGGDLSFMSDADIYSLFGNILDNAVEAVMKVEPERRAVTLSIKTVGNMIVVHETGGVTNNVVVSEVTADWPYYRTLIYD